MRPEFDVVVVGAGPAGSAASLTLARKGINVLMLEKGKVPGEKNMTGGVLYGDLDDGWGMIDLVPEFEDSAPIQRKVVYHDIVVLSKPDTKKGESMYYRLTRNSLLARIGLINLTFDTGHDYTVLRRSFDRWFANLAVQSGAMLATGTTVEGLLFEGGAVAGVRTAREEIRSNLVIDCSGVTSTLVKEAGLRDSLGSQQLYHGIKRIYKMDEATIEKKFRVQPGQGCALFFLGDFMHGVEGGAFIYTNKNTLSVGLVVSLDSLVRASTRRFDEVGKIIDIQDDFEAYPMVAELLEGAEVVEYAAHNIPKGFNCIPKSPCADGYLAAGDALGTFVKIGPMVDGMRRAIASGMMAASTYIEARLSGLFGARNLSRYRQLLAPIYKDVSRSGRDSLISESSLVYHTLPRVIFGSRVLSKTYQFKPLGRPPQGSDAAQRVQQGTSLLNYDEDEGYVHIKVDAQLASRSDTKPWVPACPVNCYTILTPKGVFASYKDLFEHNLKILGGGEGSKDLRSKARSMTLEDVAASRLRFDHVACVACGTCGAIGPAEAVTFGHEVNGHGVRYEYG